MWCDVECCNFRHGVMWNAIEMQNVRCGIWRVVECGVLDVECYRMQDVESYMMRNVVWNCGDEGCGIFNVLCDCCVISDVENDALCCDVRCDAKLSRCGGVICGIWCGAKCDASVVWNSGCGMVRVVEYVVLRDVVV